MKIERDLAPYCNTIYKMVPDFEEGDDLVLWLVFNFWSGWLLSYVEGSVTLYDRRKREIPLSKAGLGNAEIFTKTYKKDQRLRQLAVRNESTTVQGIPLVFKKKRDLLRVKYIKVHWDLLKPLYLKPTDTKPDCVCPVTLDITYNIHFDYADIADNRWFTFTHEDCLFDDQDRDSVYAKTVAEEYDIALRAGYVIKETEIDHVERFLDADITAVDTYINGEGRNLKKQEKKKLGLLRNMSFGHLTELCRIYEGSEDERVRQWDADRYYYEKEVDLWGRCSPSFKL